MYLIKNGKVVNINGTEVHRSGELDYIKKWGIKMWVLEYAITYTEMFREWLIWKLVNCKGGK